MIDAVKELAEDGWVFKYEPATRYIGINHPNGGKQSLLHFPSAERGNQFGEAIAEFLNAKKENNA